MGAYAKKIIFLLLGILLPIYGYTAPTIIISSKKRVSVGIFFSESAIHKRQKEKIVMPFSQSRLPSIYKTPYQERAHYRYLKIIRPYDGASFPINIAPPEIYWDDSVDNLWLIKITVPGYEDSPIIVLTDKKSWRPEKALWEKIKKMGKDKFCTLEIRGCIYKNKQRLNSPIYIDRIRFRISPYPLDDIIVYRLVSPLFHPQKTPDVYYRHVDSFDTRLFVQGKNLYCTNCHFFPKRPDIRPEEEKVAIAVRDQLPFRKATGKAKRILGIYEFSKKRGKTFGINSFFMSWAPDGKRVAVTMGKSVSIRPCITLETQQFFVLGSDIYIVEPDKNRIYPLKGASDPEYMENFPTWSPDGKYIVFCRAKEPERGALETIRFDLYRVPYNDGKGGKAIPIKGASFNGKSNYAPRYSPNGKWIVFNEADSASLVEPTSDLYIIPADLSAPPRKLECNVDYAMDSWHSWSLNSRWLLFATKRDDGIFARIYITEIDENGHASPPVKLPLKSEPMMCFNVPEFLRYNKEIDHKRLLKEITKQPEI